MGAADCTRDVGVRALTDPTGAALAHFGTTGMLRLQHECYSELRAPEVSFPQPTMQASYVASRALILAGSGAVDDARAALATLEPAELAALPRDLYWRNLMWMHARLARLLEDRDRAAVTVELLAPFSDLHVLDGAGIYHGAIAHHLGVANVATNNVKAARDASAAAVVAHDAAGAPAWAVRSQTELAAIRQ